MSESINKPDGQPKAVGTLTGIDKSSMLMDKIFSNPVKLMLAIGSCAIFAIMALMTVDVIGRYFFKHPIVGSDEIVGVLLICLAACGFSYTQRLKQHIRVDLLTSHLPVKARLALDLITNLIALLVVFGITWQMFVAARRYLLHLQGGSPVSVTLGIPWYPFIIILGAGFAIFGLILLADFIAGILKVGKK